MGLNPPDRRRRAQMGLDSPSSGGSLCCQDHMFTVANASASDFLLNYFFGMQCCNVTTLTASATFSTMTSTFVSKSKSEAS